MFVDSHAHLEDPRYDDDRAAVMERAREAGVRTILTIGNGSGPDDMGCGIPLTGEYDWVHTSVGIHPHDAARVEHRHFSQMEALAKKSGVVAIGETGLDFYYDNSPREVQLTVFRAQVELAKRLDLPVIIHTRDADDETIAVLEALRPPHGVVHCFTGGERLADCALDLGLMVSFSGIVTFKTADPIRAIAAKIPSDRILIETDGPYLAPVPHRGERNEPAFIVETARRLAQLREVSVEALGRQTSRNFSELFRIE